MTRLAERTRVLRWALVVVLTLAAVALVAAGVVEVCEQVAPTGQPVSVCRPPRWDDAVTLTYFLLVLAILAPDIAEAGVPGLLTLRSRVSAQEERLAVEVAEREALESRLSLVQAQVSRSEARASVTVVSGEATARYAGGGPALEMAQPAQDPVVDAGRYLGAELLLAHLDAIGSGSLRGVNLRLYLPDDAGDVLSPVLRDSPADEEIESWRPGKGVVGRAWASDEIVVARGAEVGDGLAELSPQRRARYRDLAIVMAVPVRNAQDRPIGVLSASSRDPDSSLDTPEAAGDLFGAAAVCARILVDLLGWADDGAFAGSYPSDDTLPDDTLPDDTESDDLGQLREEGRE